MWCEIISRLDNRPCYEMPTDEDSSTISLNLSKGIISTSSVHPTEVSSHASPVSPQSRSAKYINHLFVTENRCKASLFISTGKERLIHVVHYANKEEDLHTKDSRSEPDDKNYESVVVIFFIHGVGGTVQMWEPQIHYFLSQGYEIIGMDLLGHGQSSKPRDYAAYEFKELASDVEYVFDRFCKRRNVLVGHSYGSSFCTLLSKERRSKVCKTILISGGGPTMLMPDQCSAFCLPLPMFVCIRKSLVKMFQR